MSDDAKHGNNDEYQFPYNEYLESEASSSKKQCCEETHESALYGKRHSFSSSQAKNLFTRFHLLKNRRALIAVGVAIVALIAFKIMKTNHHLRVVTKAQKMIVHKKMILQKNQENSIMNNKLNKLSRKISLNENMTLQLKDQISDLSSWIDKVNSRNEEMKSEITSLSKNLLSISTKLKSIITLPNYIKKLPPSPKLTYTLRAIEPGRAWLISSDGAEDSVAVGDHLKNYGTVKAIQSDTGKVCTSSGIVITYNALGN